MANNNEVHLEFRHWTAAAQVNKISETLYKHRIYNFLTVRLLDCEDAGHTVMLHRYAEVVCMENTLLDGDELDMSRVGLFSHVRDDLLRFSEEALADEMQNKMDRASVEYVEGVDWSAFKGGRDLMFVEFPLDYEHMLMKETEERPNPDVLEHDIIVSRFNLGEVGSDDYDLIMEKLEKMVKPEGMKLIKGMIKGATNYERREKTPVPITPEFGCW